MISQLYSYDEAVAYLLIEYFRRIGLLFYVVRGCCGVYCQLVLVGALESPASSDG